MAALSARTERKLPRWIAWRFDDGEPDLHQVESGGEVGVRCTCTRVGGQPGLDLDTFVSGVAVHHQVQLLLLVGLRDLLRKARNSW